VGRTTPGMKMSAGGREEVKTGRREGGKRRMGSAKEKKRWCCLICRADGRAAAGDGFSKIEDCTTCGTEHRKK